MDSARNCCITILHFTRVSIEMQVLYADNGEDRAHTEPSMSSEATSMNAIMEDALERFTRCIISFALAVFPYGCWFERRATRRRIAPSPRYSLLVTALRRDRLRLRGVEDERAAEPTLRV